MKRIVTTLLCALALFSCSKEGAWAPGEMAVDKSAAADGGSGREGQGPVQAAPGLLTAGEWNDLDNWLFWGKLMTPKPDSGQQEQDSQEKDPQERPDYSGMTRYWGFNTAGRVAVKLAYGDGTPAPGVSVHLLQGGKTVWMARTDVLGRADCWVGMFDQQAGGGSLSITLDGTPVEGEPLVTTWQDEVKLNEYSYGTYTLDAPQPKADILFIVDATGSMSDEIAFLKADLVDILGKVEQANKGADIRTGALFYRDEGDNYLTRVSPFSGDYSSTLSFIRKQSADGGGDYPEAVHTALEHSIQKLAWRLEARTKIAFMLLDAPAHHDHQGVVESLHKSIEYYASQGIKLIPVASSGVDKDTEFMLRFFAIATGGTYVFLTNDSGIGGDHIEATVGEYQVEILNDLLVRLIVKYLG